MKQLTLNFHNSNDSNIDCEYIWNECAKLYGELHMGNAFNNFWFIGFFFFGSFVI